MGVLGYPNPVDEKVARTTAALVALLAAVALVTGLHWLLYPLALGFLARVAAGPALSPLARLATWFARARLGPPHPVPGPPKRFAQGVGAACTTVGAIALAAGSTAVPVAVLGLILAFALLESAFAFCAGCTMFSGLMRAGLIPERVCLECADIGRRRAAS